MELLREVRRRIVSSRTAETENGLFKLSVAKWGEPIPEAALEKLFEPFFRGEVRATRQALGLGCTLPLRSRMLTTVCCP